MIGQAYSPPKRLGLGGAATLSKYSQDPGVLSSRGAGQETSRPTHHARSPFLIRLLSLAQLGKLESVPRMGFPTQSHQSTHPCRTQETPAVAVWAQPSVLRSDAVRPHRSSAAEPRGGVACGSVCGMKPACAFGDSSRFHLKDKKGRHEGNDIYVLGKPSCSKLPQRRERGRGRCLPRLRAGEHLLGRQPSSRAGSIPVPRATPTSICHKMEIPACVLTETGRGKQRLEGKGC